MASMLSFAKETLDALEFLELHLFVQTVNTYLLTVSMKYLMQVFARKFLRNVSTTPHTHSHGDNNNNNNNDNNNKNTHIMLCAIAGKHFLKMIFWKFQTILMIFFSRNWF